MAHQLEQRPSTLELPKHVLVAGIDGSGKSTLLDDLKKSWDAIVMEPTSTDKARAFRSKTAQEPVTEALVDEREAIFLDLNLDFSNVINGKLTQGERVATTGNHLVTRLSHAVMRHIALVPCQPMDAVRDWAESDVLKPEAIVLTHAPFETIRDRIVARQQRGDNLESFWAFNSLFFLEQYQAAWLEALDVVSRETDITCCTVDTSTVPIGATVTVIEGVFA